MKKHQTIRLTTILALSLWAGSALSQAVPGGADAGRVEKRVEPELSPSSLQPSGKSLDILISPNAPEQSKKIYFNLRRVTIDESNTIPKKELRAIYEDYLDKEITLDLAWLIAAKITTAYHDKGYFLSRAYVPQQKIANGELRIAIIEGYIADVAQDDSFQDNELMQEWIARLKAKRPLTSEYLESVLLQMNDIPGISVRATLEPVKPGEFTDGAVRLILTKQETTSHGKISFDNNGSKFLGPNEATLHYDTVLLENQATSFHYLTSAPGNELAYASLKQRIPVFAGGYAELYGSYTKASPGDHLRVSDIASNSVSFGTALEYQLIRQRQENLSSRLAFETRESSSDILSDIALTRDRIRALRASLNYETADRWNGANQLNVTFSQGLAIFDATESGAQHLSRAEATPDFEKAEFNFSRWQPLNQNWGFITAATGQIASGPLYSSEEFGYGGQSFGRAYDASEITGDHGIAGSLEMRYLGLDAVEGVNFVPYGFYDAGAVFNDDRTQEKTQTASSAGLGLRIATPFGGAANFAVAFPIGPAIATPLYGGNRDPRYIAELSLGF